MPPVGLVVVRDVRLGISDRARASASARALASSRAAASASIQGRGRNRVDLGRRDGHRRAGRAIAEAGCQPAEGARDAQIGLERVDHPAEQVDGPRDVGRRQVLDPLDAAWYSRTACLKSGCHFLTAASRFSASCRLASALRRFSFSARSSAAL